MKSILLLFSAILLASFTFLLVKEWQIKEGYSIMFDGKYAHGSFKKLAGTIHFDPANLSASKFDVTVDVASIDTGIELKNKHARSDKWFDAEQFPVIRFTSTEVVASDSSYLVRGVLQMHGLSKEIAIPFTFKDGSIFEGKFRVSRADFGIGKTNGKESDSTSVEVSVPVF